MECLQKRIDYFNFTLLLSPEIKYLIQEPYLYITLVKMAKDDQNNETQENKKNGIIRDHNSQL